MFEGAFSLVQFFFFRTFIQPRLSYKSWLQIDRFDHNGFCEGLHRQGATEEAITQTRIVRDYIGQGLEDPPIIISSWLSGALKLTGLFVCVEVLRPSQPIGVMSSAVSLPNHTFTGQA